jgi:hypothetical protein
VGSDDESSHGGRDVANHTPPVASSVLHQDIAGRHVLTAGSTGSALRAVRPPNFHITPDVGAISLNLQ